MMNVKLKIEFLITIDGVVNKVNGVPPGNKNV
jgi:hypothetical protein